MLQGRAAAQRAGGRGAAAAAQCSRRLAATGTRKRQKQGQGKRLAGGIHTADTVHSRAHVCSRLVGVWQCNFSHAGRLAVSSAAPVDSRRIPVVLVLAALPKKPPDESLRPGQGS